MEPETTSNLLFARRQPRLRYSKPGIFTCKLLAARALSLFLPLLPLQACLAPEDAGGWVFGNWNAIDKNLGNEDTDDGTSVLPRMVVYDQANQRLGVRTIAFIDLSSGIWIIESDKGYFYRISQKTGELETTTSFYSTEYHHQLHEPMGKLFLKKPKGIAVDGKEVHRNPVNERLYTYTAVSEGFAVKDTSIQSYEADVSRPYGVYQFASTAAPVPIEASESAYALKKITYNEAGIPKLITPPLSMRYE